MSTPANGQAGDLATADALLPSRRPQHTTLPPETLAAVERISDLDRAWFKRRPDRAHRVRRRIPGEFPGDLLCDGPLAWPVFVIVKQVAVGARMKVVFRATPTPCGCEACCADLWERFASEQTKRIALDMAAILLRHGR